MQKFRVILTTLAFCGAVIAAFASKANLALTQDVYGHTISGMCVPRPQPLQQGCSVNGWGPQCTVFIPGSPQTGPNQFAPAYSNSNCNFSLHMP